MIKINNKQKHVEVLVASTSPIVWEKVVTKDNLATQRENTADAEYVAFLRIHLKDNNLGKSVITHIAKVKEIKKAPLKEYFKKYPEILKYSKEKGKNWDKYEYHKEYELEELIELPNQISCRIGTGEGKRCQERLYTTREELNKAKYLSDIKTISQLKNHLEA